MARLDKALLSKLAKKLRKPEKYIKEQISKRASRNSIKAEAQLALWAKAEKIGYQNYFNKLDPQIQSQVTSFRQTSPTPFTQNHKGQSTGERKLKVGINSFKETKVLITKQLIQESFQNANLYPTLYLFENSLRIFIQRVFSKKHGANWWDSTVNNDIKGRVASRIKKEAMNPWHGRRGTIDPLNYTDLADLVTIIRNHQKEFKVFFEDVTGGLNWLTQKLDEICHSRNNIAHSSPLNQKDITRFKVYFDDWSKQLETIEKML